MALNYQILFLDAHVDFQQAHAMDAGETLGIHLAIFR